MAAQARVEPHRPTSQQANRDVAGDRTECVCEQPARVWRPAEPGDVSPFRPDCHRPFRLSCTGCGHVLVMGCERGDADACPPCAELYRGRVQTVFREPLLHVQPGCALSVTVTAPGDDEHRMPSGELCPCTPAGGVDVARWNASSARRWNRFQQALARHLARSYGVDRAAPAKCTEIQQRGALHMHSLWRLSSSLLPHLPSKRSRKQLVREVRELAIAHGFGHSVDVQLPVERGGSVRLAAWYCAKYVSKAVTDRASVPWHVETGRHCTLDPTTGEVAYHRGDPWTYRAWSSSQRWGLTMGKVVAAQRLWAQQQVVTGTLLAPLDGCRSVAVTAPGQVQLARAGP